MITRLSPSSQNHLLASREPRMEMKSLENIISQSKWNLPSARVRTPVGLKQCS